MGKCLNPLITKHTLLYQWWWHLLWDGVAVFTVARGAPRTSSCEGNVCAFLVICLTAPGLMIANACTPPRAVTFAVPHNDSPCSLPWVKEVNSLSIIYLLMCTLTLKESFSSSLLPRLLTTFSAINLSGHFRVLTQPSEPLISVNVILHHSGICVSSLCSCLKWRAKCLL